MNILSSMLTFIAEKIGSTSMGTTATTLTGAIAENRTDIDALETSVSAIDIVAVTASLGTLTVNSNGVITETVDVSDSIPNGYTAIVAIPRTTASYAFYFYNCTLSSSTTVYTQIRRASSTTTEITPSVVLLCVKGF